MRECWRVVKILNWMCPDYFKDVFRADLRLCINEELSLQMCMSWTETLGSVSLKVLRQIYQVRLLWILVWMNVPFIKTFWIIVLAFNATISSSSIELIIFFYSNLLGFSFFVKHWTSYWHSCLFCRKRISFTRPHVYVYLIYMRIRCISVVFESSHHRRTL